MGPTEPSTFVDSPGPEQQPDRRSIQPHVRKPNQTVHIVSTFTSFSIRSKLSELDLKSHFLNRYQRNFKLLFLFFFHLSFYNFHEIFIFIKLTGLERNYISTFALNTFIVLIVERNKAGYKIYLKHVIII